MERAPFIPSIGAILHVPPNHSAAAGNDMRKSIGLLVIVYGISLSTYFGWWALRDNAALEIAVKANAPQKEMRHRINVFAEGVWFLLSNMIVLQGVGLVTSSDKEDEK